VNKWKERPIEESYLLNPAFCCSILATSVFGYSDVETKGMPYPLAFIILPMILHKPTREILPKRTSTSLATWIQNNSSARVQFFERVISLKPFVKEAILFGSCHNWLSFKEQGRIMTELNKSKVNNIQKEATDGNREILKRSLFAGKWFASVGSEQTVMTLWGIRP
jgi:hypothetical protein